MVSSSTLARSSRRTLDGCCLAFVGAIFEHSEEAQRRETRAGAEGSIACMAPAAIEDGNSFQCAQANGTRLERDATPILEDGDPMSKEASCISTATWAVATLSLSRGSSEAQDVSKVSFGANADKVDEDDAQQDDATHQIPSEALRRDEAEVDASKIVTAAAQPPVVEDAHPTVEAPSAIESSAEQPQEPDLPSSAAAGVGETARPDEGAKAVDVALETTIEAGSPGVVVGDAPRSPSVITATSCRSVPPDVADAAHRADSQDLRENDSAEALPAAAVQAADSATESLLAAASAKLRALALNRPESAGAPQQLAARPNVLRDLAGTWKVREGGMLATCSVCADGSVSFKGHLRGSTDRIVEEYRLDSVSLSRGDGWVLDFEVSTHSRLEWRKDGDERTVWTRKVVQQKAADVMAEPRRTKVTPCCPRSDSGHCVGCDEVAKGPRLQGSGSQASVSFAARCGAAFRGPVIHEVVHPGSLLDCGAVRRTACAT